MVSLRFYSEKDFPHVNYILDQVQLGYTSTAPLALNRISERHTGLEFAVTVFNNEKPAGFLTLDFGDDKFDLTVNPDSVLLRSLSINPEFQGKGIGKSVMLQIDDFIRENFKNCNEIVLAVNRDNSSAYELYRKAGYRDEGRTRMGRKGLQYLMYKKL